MDKQKVFFSYSRVDSEKIALKLAGELKEAGASVWIDQLDIKPGKLWDAEIETALENANCILFIATAKSINSNNVLNEVYYAIEENKEVIPVIFESCKLPFRLKRLQYIDFTEDYNKAFDRLLTALNLNSHKQASGIPSFKEKESIPQAIEKQSINVDYEKQSINVNDYKPLVINEITKIIPDQVNKVSLAKYNDVYVKNWEQRNSSDDLASSFGSFIITSEYIEYDHPKLKLKINNIKEVQFLSASEELKNNYVLLDFGLDSEWKNNILIFYRYGSIGVTLELMDKIVYLFNLGELPYIKRVNYFGLPRAEGGDSNNLDDKIVEFDGVSVVKSYNRNELKTWLANGTLIINQNSIVYQTNSYYDQTNIIRSADEMIKISIVDIRVIKFCKEDRNNKYNYLEIEFVQNNEMESLLFYKSTFWGGATKNIYNAIARLSIRGKLTFVNNLKVEE